MTTELTSTAINCGGCAGRAKAALAHAPGVRRVDVDVATKRVRIEYDERATSPAALADALAAAGYPTVATA